MQDRIKKRMPLPIRIVDSLIALTLRSVFRYRLDVITKNLRASFDYPNEAELKKDIKANYLYMAKILRQTIVKPGKELLERRMLMMPNHDIDQWLNEGQSVIVTFGHLGNWEWAGSFLGIRYPDK